MNHSNKAVHEFNEVHQSVYDLLILEEQDPDNIEWYKPRMTNFQYFSNEVDKAQDQVTHYDSVSNTSRKSKASKASSVSSACKKAEAEKAALQAQDAAPKNKETLKLQEQALKLQEVKLKMEMGRVELETDIAASDAKIKLLQSVDEDEEHEAEIEDESAVVVESTDGMNAYSEDHKGKIAKPGTPEVEFIEIKNVPKTPLQRIPDNQHSQPTGDGDGPSQPRAHRLSGADSHRAHSPPRPHSQTRGHGQSRPYRQPGTHSHAPRHQ